MAATGRVAVTVLRISAEADALQEIQDACGDAQSNTRGPGGTPAPATVRF